MKIGMVAGSLCGMAFLSCLAARAEGPGRPLAGRGSAEQSASQEYLLRYKFQPGDVLRWTVVNRSRVRTSVSGTTETVETTSTSIKVWRVQEVQPNGAVVFDHLVESVDMRHRLGDQEEVHYNSRTDLCAPHGFEDVARAVGVPLALVTIDQQGKVLRRHQNFVKAAVPGQGEITVQLPEQAVPVGEGWSSQSNIDVPLSDGSVRRFRAKQSYKLESVKTGVATISLATQIVTPIQDPAIEAQVLQYESSGSVRFDIERGQILGRQNDVDKSVVGFRGEASNIRYIGRSTEEFLPAPAKVAADR
jgi:hypothetical protein